MEGLIPQEIRFRTIADFDCLAGPELDGKDTFNADCESFKVYCWALVQTSKSSLSR